MGSQENRPLVFFICSPKNSMIQHDGCIKCSRRRYFFSASQHANCIADCFFVCLHAVFVHFVFVFDTMGQTARTAYTAADTCHAFYEVSFEDIFSCLEQSHLAGFYAVAGYCLQFEVVNILLFECLNYCIAESAASGKYPAVVGGIVQYILLQGSYFHIFAVE